MQAQLASDAHRTRRAVESDEYVTITCMRVGRQPGPHDYIQQTYRSSEKAESDASTGAHQLPQYVQAGVIDTKSFPEFCP
jgi:hypothetical protein